jgi:hypothetical protein
MLDPFVDRKEAFCGVAVPAKDSSRGEEANQV